MEKQINMPLSTNQQYDQAVASCRQVFLDKTRDYGTSWRVLRIISVVDQIFIKAQRIRTIQEKRVQKIGDSVASEFMGIVNYCAIGLIQMDLESTSVDDISVNEVAVLYDRQIDRARKLMLDKNHDYGEAWRDMSQESFVDLILVKLLRIRQILANDGKTKISEGIDANIVDMLNYAIFGLILIDEGKHRSE